MKFQWPKSPEEILDISQQEYKWLLEGLKIEQPKAHRKMEKINVVY
jgi:transposase